MSAFSAVSVQPSAARKAERQGVAAVLEDQTALDHVHGIARQLNEELVVEPTLDALVNRIQGGYRPRVLILDLLTRSRRSRNWALHARWAAPSSRSSPLAP
jgi:hypothetical protein